ncbi:hypothetical protein MF271_16695 [Deinococcus sp. KNUC1210]|uniref:hypothetical protein n=1 Tax=Deinococcus sp. KNUC1210 TaxID=2917691 RepID=UPI001EEFA98F|nr:hypothetical protein [Deinococcus sp. KNUC1210]ULH15527.1 hypothetical protein MF271_16695 [Deinococcus sp. KNUC1210]
MLDALMLPDGWTTIDDPKQQAIFEAELSGEVVMGHPLHGVQVRTLARRDGRDDFLFELLDSPGQLAVVHLTWVHTRYGHADRPPWPWTRIHPSIDEWKRWIIEDTLETDDDIDH